MIVSKYGKCYQTSDGSEQPAHPRERESQDRGRTAKQSWEDDGGPSNDQPTYGESELGQKPIWSVLSLRKLNQAVEQSLRADDPWRLHQNTQRSENEQSRADNAEASNAEAAERATRNLYRNPWEHT